VTAGDLRKAGIGAARDARELIAGLLEEIGDDHPELARALSSAVGSLYGAEVGDDRRVLSALGEAMTSLRALLDEDRWAADDTVARPLSRALALMHSPRAALARALGDGSDRADATAPFLLTSARVKASDVPEEGERRDASRHQLEVAVGLEGASRFYTGKTGDLGRGGLFVASDEPLPVGTEVILSFVLPDGYRVRAEGAVAWVRAPRYRPHELPGGMGVRFEHLDEADLYAIRFFLEQRPPFHYGE